jgi:hypothetical protein
MRCFKHLQLKPQLKPQLHFNFNPNSPSLNFPNRKFGWVEAEVEALEVKHLKRPQEASLPQFHAPTCWPDSASRGNHHLISHYLKGKVTQNQKITIGGFMNPQTLPQLMPQLYPNFEIVGPIWAILVELRWKLGHQSWGIKKGSWVQLTNANFVPQLQLQFDKNCPNWAPSWGWSWGRSWRCLNHYDDMPGLAWAQPNSEPSPMTGLWVVRVRHNSYFPPFV